MQNTITGFQFDPKTGRYIGEYEFPNNMDQEDIHLPPNTTLERPPAAEEGKIAVRVDNGWQIQNDPNAAKQRPQIDDYLMLTDGFIAMMEEQGLWTSEDRRLREEAIAENERKKAEIEAMIAAQKAAGSAA